MAGAETPSGAGVTDPTDSPLETVRAVELPERVDRLVEAYEAQFDDRDRFLWQWIYALFPEFTLSSVADEHASHVRIHKTTLTMYVTVLDDLLESHGDRATFLEACKCHQEGLEPDPDRTAVDAGAVEFVEQVWTAFEAGLDAAPRREAFGDVLAYDLDQTVNAVEYSAVLSETPEMANLKGARRYDSHNMVLFAYTDVDLAYSPGFELSDFGVVRDLVWDLQEMARIGNWVTTWERELREGDYSSGVVVTALQEGVLTPADLESGDHAALVRTVRDHDIEKRYRRRWERLHRSVARRGAEAGSVDLDALVRGMETVFEYHLASEGLK
jgi:hypothetical protein